MTRFKRRTLKLLSVCFIALTAVLLDGLPLPAAHAGEMTDWAAALKPAVSVLEQKIAQLPAGSAKSSVESRVMALRSLTTRLVQIAESVDGYAAREAALKNEIETKKAALDHILDVQKQAMADIERRLDQIGRESEIHNASAPAAEAPEAAHTAYNARASEGNQRLALLQDEKGQLQEKLKAESKPASDAYWAAMKAAGDLDQKKQKAAQPLYEEYKVWNDQHVWLNAAVDIAASGTDPASALTPFPTGGIASGEAGLAAREVVSAGTSMDAGAQLKSVEAHSREASANGNKDEAGKGFDTLGRDEGALVVAEASAGRPVPAFVARLPEAAMSDAQIQQSAAYYQKLDTLKAETEQKIQKVKAEQQAGKGDAAVLAAHLGTLTNDLKRHEGDQAQAKETMRKRVKDLGFDWNEQ